ncbi:Growth factor receptor-bound protein 10 [Varanus komodoensis]|nr:Growth factor receptor-bound protein 10 [Varanus komodoensis]
MGGGGKPAREKEVVATATEEVKVLKLQGDDISHFHEDVKVFSEDGTCKVVEILADMTARDLCQLLVYKSHCVDDNSWTLVEHHPLLGLDLLAVIELYNFNLLLRKKYSCIIISPCNLALLITDRQFHLDEIKDMVGQSNAPAMGNNQIGLSGMGISAIAATGGGAAQYLTANEILLPQLGNHSLVLLVAKLFDFDLQYLAFWDCRWRSGLIRCAAGLVDQKVACSNLHNGVSSRCSVPAPANLAVRKHANASR